MTDVPIENIEGTTFSTAVLYDAARRLGLEIGIRGVRPMSRRTRVVGRAYTVKFVPVGQHPKTSLNFYDIVTGAPKSRVLVLGVGVDRWVFGGNLSRFAELQGVRGIVMDGCMRDVAAIRERDYPIFATGASVSGYATERMLSAVGEDIVCGGIAVATEDFIVGDDDGVVCLPKARVQEILFEAEEVEHLDLTLEGDIEKGLPLADLHKTRVRWSARRRTD
jgi:4-hydroxy-4-methyl-2-oxoglutarate aldolase